MSIPSYDPLESYIGTNNQTAYTFGFKITDLGDILIVCLDNTGTEIFRDDGTGTGSFLDSVVLNDDGTGTINLVANLPSSYKLFLFLAPDEPVQLSRFRDKFDFKLSRVEDAYDYAISALQRVVWRLNRTIQFDDTADLSGIPTSVPAPDEDSVLGTGTSDKIMTWINRSAFKGDKGDTGDTGATGATGAKGDTGSTGSSGTNGSLWRSGAGAPSDGTGVDGDLYLRTSNADVYQRASGTYTVILNIKGPTGLTGATGAAGADGASAVPVLTGSRGTPQNITAAGGIAFTGSAYQNIWFVQGNAGAITVTANPQIAAGTAIGQRLKLIQRSGTNSLTFADGNGLDLLGGALVLSDVDQSAEFLWDGTVWVLQP